MLRTCALLLTVSGAALAQPKAPAKPSAKPACVPAEVETRWVVAGGLATVCFKPEETKPEQCWAYSSTVAPRSVPAPAVVVVPKPEAEVRDEGGVPSACVGTKCKKLGKKTAAAIAKAKAEAKATAAETGGDASVSIAVSGDGKAVVIGNQLWSVAGDKPIKLKAPKEYKGQIDKPEVSGISVAGGALIASWLNCAGPCTRSILIDSSGNNRGDAFGAGFEIPLDAKRLAILPAEVDTTFVVLDLATAKQVAKLSLGNEGVIPGMSGTKLDDNTVAAVWKTSDDKMSFKLISAPAGKPVTISSSYQLPACPP
jgi:hypothetical protein